MMSLEIIHTSTSIYTSVIETGMHINVKNANLPYILSVIIYMHVCL